MKNSHIAKGFDLLAPFYTVLTKTVFGKSLEQSQLHFLHYINSNDRVLILGGGNGNFLKSLLTQYPKLTIDYLDISPKMLRFSKQKTKGENVTFVCGSENDIPGKNYTVVITNFYLDLFSNTTLNRVIGKIKQAMKNDSRWLVTDFVSESSVHKILLWMMYRFFRIITRIDASRLPHWESLLAQAGGEKIDSKRFYNKFILTTVYKFKL